MEPRHDDPNTISLVSDCAATQCKFNESHHCTAGQIKLVFFEGKPECGTYSDEEEEKN
jgi:hypothetical protein